MLSFPNSCEKTFFWSFRVHLKIKWCNDHKLGITKFWTNQRWLGRKFSCLPFQSVLYSEMNNISAENVCPHSAHLSMYFQAQLCVKHQFSQWYLLEAWKIFCSFLPKRNLFKVSIVSFCVQQSLSESESVEKISLSAQKSYTCCLNIGHETYM